MRILITGGAGFIGSHLAQRLVARGDSVGILDDLSTGCLTNVAALLPSPHFECRVGSAAVAGLVGELVERCDAVIHLAAAVGVRLIIDRPVATIQTNVQATDVVLAAAAREGKRVVLSSTSEVYGKSDRVPFREEDDLRLGPTTHARWAYACSKALDEWLALAWHQESGLPVTVARLLNTVGPRQTGRYGMVLPSLAAQALKGEPLTVFGSGTQTRCFAHVDDVVEALVRLLDRPETAGQVFNVGSEEEITIRDLAARVRDAAGSSSRVELVPYDEAYARGFEDMPRRVPCCDKLERAIGFKPATPLDRIIEDVLADQARPVGERSAPGASASHASSTESL